MTGETRKRKWDICFDPRTKVLLLIISMIIATTAPSLSYECALILLIAFMGILCGKVRYSIIGTIVFLALYLFTTLYLGNVTGTAYTMFTAWLSLVFKVYPCGMLAGIAVSTTRVNEFLSAMNKAHVPKKSCNPFGGYAALPSNNQRGLAFYQRRYALTRCISVSERAYLPSWHDHRVLVFAASYGGI